MKLDEFIAIQRPIIEENGLADFLPCVFVDAEELEIKILSNPPEDAIELELTAREWATSEGREFNYFLAFARDLSNLQVVARLEGNLVECVVPFESADENA
jgi:hypothetical protein